MPEDVTNHFAFPSFAIPVPGTMREVLGNDTIPRDKIYLNRIEMTKIQSGGASMMLKTGMGVAQDYTSSNYVPPRPQKY